MKRTKKNPPHWQWSSAISVILTTTGLLVIASVSTTAQTIIPAPDGTGTHVNSQGNQFNINGGRLSADGVNLFHSFEKLGLSQGQILNFISNPTIQNILGRVTGGEASFINGLIQVTGGNSNLFLINPAGIIFGENASLNIPASFTATTASSIGFGNQNWFQAFGDNQWQTLVGTPSDFIFNPENPGSLVNLGNLTVSPGENISLLAGTILNTGTLSAPGGQITIAAVTGENLVRLSLDGHLLNLELPSNLPEFNSNFTPLSLPELLTGGTVINANTVKVNAQGQVILTSSGVVIPSDAGTNIISGQIDVSSSTQTGGSLQLAGERIGLLNSTLNASGLTGGGTILIGGDYKGLGNFPTAEKTFISSDSFINANALETGNGGEVIILSEELTQVYGGIQVQGGTQSGNGGFVETSSHGVLEINQAPDISAASGLGGTWLIDPNNIDIVDSEANTNINQKTGELLFKTTDDNARLSVFKLRSALTQGNVIVETSEVGNNTQDGNITFKTSLDFDGIQGERSLTLNAIGNIILNGYTISDSNPGDTDQLNVNFNADFDNNNNGAVFIRNATIDTNGGDFTATGRGNSIFPSGVWIDNSQLNTLGGNVNLEGFGVNSQPFNHGILLTNSVLNSGSGNISLTGTSGTQTDTNIGVWLNQSTLNSEAGTINIIGNSQGNITNNIGILLNNNSTLQTTTGNITLTGNSQNGFNSFGVNFNQGNLLTVDGVIQLTGTSEGNDGSVAVYLSNSSMTSTGSGNINVQGNNNATGNNNDGISILNNTMISSSGTGTLNLSGVSGDGNNSEGVFISNGQIITVDGEILINGIGRGINTSPGVFVGEGGEIVSTGIGNINLDGLSSATGSGSHGISLFGGATLETTTTGNITLVGSSSQSTNSQGIFIFNNSLLQVNDGNLNLIGVSQGEFNGQGILLGNSLIQSSGTGSINLRGTGNGSGGDSNGILVINAAQINSFGSGDINLRGRSAEVPESEGVGIFQASQIQTNTGSILIDGVNNGSNTTSVVIGDNTPVTTTGSGEITISGNQNLFISSLTNSGGAINLKSSQGNINSSFGILDSSSTVGNGGNITVDAADNLTIASINTSTTANSGNTKAGSVTLNSANDIVTLTNNINTSATAGQGNNITISAPVQLTQPTTIFNTSGSTGSGNIIFNNTVDGATPGSQTLILQAGTGNISFNDSVGSLNPLNNLTIIGGNINSIAPMNLTNSGLRINASGEVNLADILAHEGANVDILSSENIITQDIVTDGETITLRSSNGDINTQAGILDSSSTNNNGGNQTLDAFGSVTLGEINTRTASNSTNSQGGTLTITSGDHTINLTGDINTSATQGQGSNINFNANVILGSDNLTLTTTGNNSSGNVTFNGTVNGSQRLTLQTGEGNVSFNQAVGDSIPLQTLTINSGNVVSESTVTVENGGINITATQDVNFGGRVTTNNSSVEVVAEADITTQDMISNSGGISLTSNTGNIHTTAGILNSSSTTQDGGEINLNAANNLTVGAINTRTESNLETSQAGTLTLAGNQITLTNNIDTSATQGSGRNITFNSPVILNADSVTLTTSGTAGSGNITLNNTVNSNTPGNSNLTIQAGTGTVTVNETIGGTNTLNGLTVNSGDMNSHANITVENGGININSQGTVNLTAPIIVNHTGTININAVNNITTSDLTTEGQAINISSNTGTIDSSLGTLNTSSNNSNGGNINITTTATATLGEINTSTQSNQAGTLTVNSEKVELTGNINTSGNSGSGSNLTFNQPVELNQPITLNTSGVLGSGNITFNNTVNSIPPNNNGLTLQAGDVQFNNTVNVGGLDITARIVNSTSAINVNTGNLRINSSDSVTLSQDINTSNNSFVEITATNNIITGNITTNGQAITLNSINGNITTNPGILNTSSVNNGGNITLNTPGTLNLGGVNTSTINGQAGSLTFNSANNPIILNRDINTSANNGIGSQQQYNRPVQLASPNIILTSLGSNGSGNISFNFPVNGNSNLTVNTGNGNIIFSSIGDTNPLLSLQVNTTGQTTLQGNLTVNNIVDFSNALGGTQLANPITINTSNNNGAILFNNSPITGSQTLILNAGNGNISLNTVGNNNNPINTLIFQQANIVNLLGNIYTATGLDFYPVNTVNIAANSVTLDTSINKGAINFIGSTLTGQGNLTLNAGNNDVNLDTFIPENPLNGLAINARSIQANAPITVGFGGLNLNTSNLVNLTGNTFSNNRVVITATNDINTRDITATGAIILNSNNGNITVNSLNTSSLNSNSGEISLNTQQGDITTNNLNTSSLNGNSGGISLKSQAGSITTGNLRTSGMMGGDITVNAQTQITTGQIDTQGQTQAGNVFLDPINDIQVEFINAESPNGRGGNIFVESTQGNFRALSSFPSLFSPTGVASLSTAGRLGNGSITIRHAGGQLNPPASPFVIKDNLTINGAVSTITNGNFSLIPPQTFEGSFILGNLAIQTDDAPNIPPTPTPGNTGVILQEQLLIPPTPQAIPQAIPSEFINNPTHDSLPQDLLSTPDVAFNSNSLDLTILTLEQLRNQEFASYLGVQGTLLDRLEVQQQLKKLEIKTKQVYAIVYLISREDQLEIIVIPSSGEPLRHSVPEATQEKLFPLIRSLQTEITNPRKRDTISYQAPAQQLYQWMIQPITEDLQKLGVSTILFSLDPGLRSLPIAALWDGQQFLIEKYAISIIPSTSFVDFRYQPIGEAEVLAMGASQFQDQNPLPAVPVELANIIQLWPGEEYLNERFTLENLKFQRRLSDFEVIHLATHADFKAGSPNNSYIQLWNEKLPLSELPSLNWDNPTVELLTLSACRTALGDRRSELGFAGLAVQAGVKSALASLWYVSDQGTLGLMSEFYQDLKQAPIKAIALQKAQLDMIQGTTRIENDQLITSFGAIPLPDELKGTNITNLSHPYYWSGFTMIGSPW